VAFLTRRHGLPCARSDTPLVPASELPARLAALPQWRLAADGKSIEKAFVARNFVAGASGLSSPG
jgi:pterin-4a-carbinolamine dehydratase